MFENHQKMMILGVKKFKVWVIFDTLDLNSPPRIPFEKKS